MIDGNHPRRGVFCPSSRTVACSEGDTTRVCLPPLVVRDSPAFRETSAIAGGLRAGIGVALPGRQRLPGDPHVRDPKRFLPVMLLCASDPRPQPDPSDEGRLPAGASAKAGPAQGRLAQPVRERESPSGFGTLAVRVQPRDAAVFVDGEEWSAPDGPGPLLLELASGSHQIEVRRQGFTTYRTTVQVRGNETVTLNVSLSR